MANLTEPNAETVAAAQAELARRNAEAARAELARRSTDWRGAVGTVGGETYSPTTAEQARQGQTDGLELVAEFPDNGRVYRATDGTLSAVSAGFSTQNQDDIAAILQGATPANIVQNSFDNQRIDANPVAARANELVRGVPFVGSYADEAIGVFNPQAAENMRDLTGAMQRQNPLETMGLNISGALAGAIPMAAAAGPSLLANASQSLGVRALQGAAFGTAVGATEGAIYGAGEGEARDERVQNAQTGGLIGAGLGMGLGAAGPYLAAGARNLLNTIRGTDTATVAKELGVSPAAAAVVRQALASGDDEAALAALRRAGDDAMLADANPNTQSLLDTAAQSPGQAGQVAREAVAQRTQQATTQMTDALDDVLGPARGEREIMSEIAQQSAPARSEAYDAAYSAAIDYTTPQAQAIEGLLARVPQNVINRANELMRIRGEESAQIMATITEGGPTVFRTMPDVRQLDYITRALNDIAAEADGAGKLGGQTDLGMSIQALSRNIRQNLRVAVPEYGRALETAADAISQRNGVETGYDLLRAGTRREDIGRAINGATEPELAAMRQGVRSFIDDTTANVTRTITDGDTAAREGIQILRQMSSRGNITKLRMLLGRTDADRLLGEIDQAATSFELRAAIAMNSRTYARTAMNDVISEQTAPGLLRTLAQGEPVNAAKRIIQGLTGETAEATQARQMGLYEEIAEALTSVRGMNAQRSLQMMTRAIEGQPLNDQQARVIANAVIAAFEGSGVPVANREISQVQQR